MNNHTIAMDLVAGYGAYADTEELTASAVSDAPATTWVCVTVVSLESSAGCAATASAAVSAVGGTIAEGC
ncbi:LxmA leader domain family RiPP [Streptomyces sp. MH13]|uniref:LxmA leader domain family RiPP n=1 Tax=unclassified Streptomyces TaxID=2593676 RepID=UPI003CF2E526